MICRRKLLFIIRKNYRFCQILIDIYVQTLNIVTMSNTINPVQFTAPRQTHLINVIKIISTYGPIPLHSEQAVEQVIKCLHSPQNTSRHLTIAVSKAVIFDMYTPMEEKEHQVCTEAFFRATTNTSYTLWKYKL